jgi:hypothetical protein
LANGVSVLDVMLASLELRGVEAVARPADEQGQPRDDPEPTTRTIAETAESMARATTAWSSCTAPIGWR